MLMEHLPPVGWADVATKRDLELLQAQLRAEFADLSADFAGLRADLGRDQRDLQRNLFFGLATAQAAFAGLVVALVG